MVSKSSRALTFALTLIFLTIFFGCSSLRFEQRKQVDLKENKLFMNYFKYWFKSFGHKVDSIHNGFIFGPNKFRKGSDKKGQFKRVPFFKKKFLIMTSLNFLDGEKGNCLVDLSLLKKEFKEGNSPFHINFDCETPFKSFEREKALFPEISKTYSIKLKPILNFKAQRSFRYFVESKRWPLALKQLKLGADPKVYINKYKNIGTTPLNIAFSDFGNFYNRMHSVRFINELLKVKGVLNFKDASGKSSLSNFLLKDKRLVVEKLIHEGASLRVNDKKQKEGFMNFFKNYKKKRKGFMERFYQKLNDITQFPSSISIKMPYKNN